MYRSNPRFAQSPACIIASPLPLTLGARLGVYEVTAEIGEGGMGQVFPRAIRNWTATSRSRSARGLRQDVDRLARFQREAKTLASLNQSNIAIIHGLEQAWISTLSSWSSSTARICRSALREARFPLTRRCPSPSRLPTPSKRRTSRGYSPRSETREFQGPRRRLCESPGLWARQGDRANRCGRESDAVPDDHDTGDDASRDDPGHGGVHEPGAGARAGSSQFALSELHQDMMWGIARTRPQFRERSTASQRADPSSKLSMRGEVRAG